MSEQQTCGCGHPFDVHKHYRAGNDCGTCGPTVCSRFSRARAHTGGALVGTLVTLLAAGKAHITPGSTPSHRRH